MDHIKFKDGVLRLLDQRGLPHTARYFECRSAKDAEVDIKDMIVRGAPAIGITAAYGLAMAAMSAPSGSFEAFWEHLFAAAEAVTKSRPTAVNLMWAVDRVIDKVRANRNLGPERLKTLVLDEATAIHSEDVGI